MSILLKTGNTYTSVLTSIDIGGGWKQLVPTSSVSANTAGDGAGNSGNSNNNNHSKNDKKD